MGAGSSLLADVVALDGAAAALRAEFGVDRVSIARFSPDRSTFEIVACAGKALLSPGLDVPVELSTQMQPPALGEVFVEASFRNAPHWSRPVDELMLGIGFQSGCSLPLACPDGSLGAVSFSATRTDCGLDRCVHSAMPLLAGLAGLLGGARRERVLVCHDDPVIAHGLATLIERDGRATATCVDAGPALTGRLPGGPWACVVAGPFLAGRPVCELAATLERAGEPAPLIVVAGADALAAHQIAATGGAAAAALTGLTEFRLKQALGSVAAAHALRRDDTGVVRLSPREGDVLLDLDDGLRFKEIARRHGIREPTAKSYARTLFEKLDAHSRTEAVNRARELGLLSSLRSARADRGRM
jgi:DNA-binding NarL/FixJ family response regulator